MKALLDEGGTIIVASDFLRVNRRTALMRASMWGEVLSRTPARPEAVSRYSVAGEARRERASRPRCTAPSSSLRRVSHAEVARRSCAGRRLRSLNVQAVR